MPRLLDGKVVVITGGASGIGRATALRCAAEGASVVVGDRLSEPREGGEPTHEAIRSAGGTARFVTCDVRKAVDVEALMAAADGLGGVDVLVNNAGIFRRHDFLELDDDSFDDMFDINVKAVFFVAQAAARRMVGRGSGLIVNLSSGAGLRGSGGYTTYCATKAAVRFFTMALADELGPRGVRVCAVHPGAIQTSMLSTDVLLITGEEQAAAMAQAIPLRRAGTPDDVAGGIVLLASDLATYITGASLVIDGGNLRI
jgi:NAD(P)-dependent dehydrogenase (short-subunit alcohol dehydrogenase family)